MTKKKPEYNYVHEVDYCSGASLLFRKDLFQKLGGFDERFAPAYYEDTDIAFQIREHGLKVYYQPESVVVHYEGGTNGTDVRSGIKAYQVQNRTRMHDKWLTRLHADHYRNGEHITRARDHGKRRRVMLMIDHYCPEPDRDAGSRNMIEVIKSLQLDNWIIKFWPDNLHYDATYTRNLQQMGIEVIYSPWAPAFGDWMTANGRDVDAFFLSRPTVAPRYFDAIKRINPAAPVLFYGHDLHSARMRMQADLVKDTGLAEEAAKMETVEREIWKQVDVALYPSCEEVDKVSQLEPSCCARILVPFCFDDFRSVGTPPDSRAIIFVAGFAHAPNVDAAVWFVREILPLVKAAVPDATLWIVGSNPSQQVRELENSFIRVTGYVTAAELNSLYQKMRVAVVPLRFGAGIKLKVVEAIHEGVPLVTTSVGAQGIKGLSEVARVTDDAKNFAKAVVDLLKDNVEWRAQSARQLDYARAHFSRENSILALRTALEEATARAMQRTDALKSSRSGIYSAASDNRSVFEPLNTLSP